MFICPEVTNQYDFLLRPSDSHAMAGMALQCLKDERIAVKDTAELDKALATIKQRLLDSKRADGHMGNEFSTGLAVQVRMKILYIWLNEKALFE